MASSFDFRKRLGAGFFGEVWHAIDTGLNCEVALKCIPPDKVINRNNLFQEAQALKAAEHPNIVRVNDTGLLDDNRIYVSMEFLPDGSVEDEASGAPLPLSRCKRLMVDALRGLGHAHSQGVIHRDVKPANILIGRSREGKLSDFGLALKDINNLKMSSLKQYQYIMHLAPEVLNIEDYTSVSDIYAAGVTLYRLVNGDSRLPQIPLSEAQARAKLGTFPPRSGYRDFVPQSLRRLINRAMSVEPSRRFQTAEDMRHALEGQVLLVDWSESGVPSQSVWTGDKEGTTNYEVRKFRQRDLLWAVEVRRNTCGKSPRRISKYCVRDQTGQQADRHTRRVLQDLTTGKCS